MIDAFVLIQAGVGMASRVGQTVRGMPGGALCRCRDRTLRCGRPRRAARLDALGSLVVSKIQPVEGVDRTLTCPVVRL
jgi:hypothetical protein